MKTFEYEVKDALGLHARPAALLAKEAKKYGSWIMVSNGIKTAEATQMLQLMSMGVKKGQRLTVTLEGMDEEEAAEAIGKFIGDNL